MNSQPATKEYTRFTPFDLQEDRLMRIVTSFDISRRLKEIGISQKSIFIYDVWGPRDDGLYPWRLVQTTNCFEYYSAFTVSELIPLCLQSGIEIVTDRPADLARPYFWAAKLIEKLQTINCKL